MASNFESGVTSYIKTYAVVEVYFPVDDKGRSDISCKRCPFLTTTGIQAKCQLNKKLVVYPDKCVGDYCPLQLIEEKED